MVNEYTDLIQKAKELAILSFKKFVNKLGYNEEAFEHIYNINITLDNLKLENATYDHVSNLIILDKGYVDDAFMCILLKPEEENKYIVDIGKTIVHEMIHANRMIMINYDSTVYSKDYSERPNINDKPSGIEEARPVKSNILKVVSEYDLKYNGREESLSSEKTIKSQFNLEEALTSVISVIMIMTRKSDDLDIEPAINRIKEIDAYDSAEKATALLIEKHGVELLKWFMTSTYDDVYYNYFLNKYGEDYDKLVKYIASGYDKYDSSSQERAERIVNKH